MLNYYEIGQRIRKYRKAHGWSQEQLAEKIDISVTHMSHIETGNTKMSLPVLAAIATELEVRTDDLLFNNTPSGTSICDNITELLGDCSTKELQIIQDLISTAKVALRKYS